MVPGVATLGVIVKPFCSVLGVSATLFGVRTFSSPICFSHGTLGAEIVVVTDATVVVSTGAGVVAATVVVDSVVVSGTGASVTVVVVVIMVVVSSKAMQATADTGLTSDGWFGVVGVYVIFRAVVASGVLSETTTVLEPSGTD